LIKKKGVVGTCKFDKTKVVAVVTDFSDIPKGDEEKFKEAVYNAV